ncbi:MAG: SecD/SecF family protein translocase subunit, partial [Chloroflexales bacterium]|nr:SecD/SecF family protein translocase subunit [Chloroflexales bacterium]
IFNQLKFGALPIPLVVETSRTVSATLGQESVDASLIAGGVGLGIVALFMVLFYRLPGVIAVIALMVYTALTFAIYRFIPVTLTLSGIAGFILSIGLAVDENVLIFARIREEYRRRRDLRASLEPGFNDSWSAIRDSAIATLITSAVLFTFGNSFGLSIIKGFAVTLGLGTVISVFTAVVVTRTILRLVILSPAVYSNPWLFGVERDELRPAPVAIEPETV